MKSRASIFFLLLFLSINCYGLTSYCYHDGGLTPTLRNMGSYTNADYLLDTQHAIRSRLYNPISDTDWDIITMQSGGGARTVSLGVTGQFGSWVFDGASMRGFYESPIFWAAPGYEECDHTYINNEVTTTLTVSDNTVKAGDSITITWSGVNATKCTAAGETWATSGTLPLIATEDLAGTHSMTCVYQDGYPESIHLHDSDQSTPFTMYVTPSCYVTSEEINAVATMSSWSTLPYEQGIEFICDSDTISNAYFVDSFNACAGCPAQINDPCKLSWYASRTNRIAAAHSHPFFQDASEYLPSPSPGVSVGCYGPNVAYPNPTSGDLDAINLGAEDYSGLDYGSAASLGGTLYLKTPTGVMKKYDGAIKVLP